MSTSQLIIIGGVLFWLMTCWAILDIARKDFGSMEIKAVWIVFCALVPFIGVAVYLILGFRKGIPSSKNPATDQN